MKTAQFLLAVKPYPRRLLGVVVVSALLILLPSTVLAAQPGEVVINEVEYNPIQSGDDSAYEWFELYNRTDAEISFSGWTITDNNKTETFPNLAIPPLTFKVLAASANVLTNYPLLASAVVYWSDSSIGNGLANSGDRLILKDATGTIVDQISWGSDKTILNPSIPSVADGHSVERLPYGLDTDSALDFIDQSNPSPGQGIVPTPTLTPTPVPTPTLTPTPSPTSTPTVTPVPTASPTPTIIKQVLFSAPNEISVGQAFNVSVSLNSFKVNTLYYIKVLIGKDASSMTDGKTLGADSSTWLAWNGSWNKMPQAKTDSLGSALLTVSAKTDDDVLAGNYQLAIKIKEGETDNFDTSVYQSIKAVEALPSATPVPSPSPLTVTSSTVSSLSVKGSLKQLKLLKNGTKIEAEGLVSAPFGILGADYFYLDDGENGIMVKSKNKIALSLGQRVKVSSTIEESYDERYIKTDNVTIINNSTNPPVPQLIRLDKINESAEGKLITVSGRIFETSGKSFWVSDGWGSLKVYLKDSTGIKLARKKPGDYVKITGVLSQWGLTDEEEPNYRLLPRFQSDVWISEAPVGEIGQVLGAMTLPKTGTGILELPNFLWQEVILPNIRRLFR